MRLRKATRLKGVVRRAIARAKVGRGYKERESAEKKARKLAIERNRVLQKAEILARKADTLEQARQAKLKVARARERIEKVKTEERKRKEVARQKRAKKARKAIKGTAKSLAKTWGGIERWAGNG